MQNERFLEYPHPQMLEGNSASYFMVPASLILDNEAGSKSVTIFSFLSIRRGLDKVVSFTINGIAKWMGKRPNRNPNGVNNKIIKILKHLEALGYLTLPPKIENTALTEAIFHLDNVKSECDRKVFAVLYVDEVQKILHFKSKNKDYTCNSDIVLLVFAWLRMRIYRRANYLRPEEVNVDNKDKRENDIKVRRKVSPDAYDCFYKDIAKELSLSERQVSKAVAALNELELIYSEALPRSQNADGDWKTEPIIFCNYYKREKDHLLAQGSDYYSGEVDSKKNLIKEYKKRRGKNHEK